MTFNYFQKSQAKLQLFRGLKLVMSEIRSNSSLSATNSTDTALISARIVQQFFLILFSVTVLNAAQERSENSINNLKPITSHSIFKEKTVVVPPEVALRWKAVKLAVIDKIRGTENIYLVPIGIPFKIHSTSLLIHVEAFLPAFTMEGAIITSATNELINPAIKVTINENGNPVFQGWIFSKFPKTHAVTHPKYGFTLIGFVPVGR